MPENFKTGYVADPISYTALGTQIGKSLSENLANIQSRIQEKKRESDTVYGFSKSMGEIAPSAVEPRYKEGLQHALDILQETAVQAKRNNSIENVRAFTKAKQQFEDMKNTAVSKAAQNYSTLSKVKLGEFPGMVGTPEDVEQEYFDATATPVWRRVGNEVMITSGGASDGTAHQQNWANTTLGDIRDIYVPQVKAPESEFEATQVATNIVATLDRKVDVLQVLDRWGFATGEVNTSEAYSVIGDGIKNTIKGGGSPALSMISLFAFGSIDMAGKELDANDPAKALRIYNPEINSVAFEDGTPVTQGAIDENGEYVFATADSAIPNNGVGSFQKDDIVNWRTAYKNYFDTVTPMAFQDIKEKNEFAQSQARQLAIVAAMDSDEGNYIALTLDEAELNQGTELEPKLVNTLTAKASVSGRTFEYVSEGGTKTRINDAHFDIVTGDPIAFDVLQLKAGIDAMTSFMDAANYNTITLHKGREGFEEALRAFKDIAPSGKKHGGSSFLQHAKAKIEQYNAPATTSQTPSTKKRQGGWGTGVATAAFADISAKYMGLLGLIPSSNGSIVDQNTADEVGAYVDGLSEDEQMKAMENIVNFAKSNLVPTISAGTLVFVKPKGQTKN